jgi:uncharacterized protein
MIVSAAVVFLCLALGGVLKGATGAGAPILAVPAMAAFADVRFAVAVMLVPSLVSNVWQGWRFRAHLPRRGFAGRFSMAGGVGAVLGTVVLASLPHEALSLLVALAVFGYVGFRLLRAEWGLSFERARSLSVPVGAAAGLLQGASGISAPVTLSFLNAMRLERPVFIALVSVFFAVMTGFQIPAAAALGILTPERLALSAMALAPLMGAMPVGAALARRVSREAFDRVILALLVVLALKLVLDALG